MSRGTFKASWPKNVMGFAFGETFLGISECHPTMAAVDPSTSSKSDPTHAESRANASIVAGIQAGTQQWIDKLRAGLLAFDYCIKRRTVPDRPQISHYERLHGAGDGTRTRDVQLGKMTVD
jgi:hypothetical protein